MMSEGEELSARALGQMLRRVAGDLLSRGWLYIAAGPVTERSECILIADGIEDVDPSALAASLGFPIEGLETEDLKSIFNWTARLTPRPTDDNLVDVFLYYLKFDAFLPEIGANDPPSRDEIIARLDREFFDKLGPERVDTPCSHDGCERGAITLSVHCRIHHFENIKRKPCPFDE